MLQLSRVRRCVSLALITLLLSQLLACGTILYPDRRGQAAGRLDLDIVVLDAIGLLFFIVPGVVAFAVDFATGTIYLPKGGHSKVLHFSDAELRSVPMDGRTPDAIEALVEDELGVDFDLGAPEVLVVPAANSAELKRLLPLLSGGFARSALP